VIEGRGGRETFGGGSERGWKRGNVEVGIEFEKGRGEFWEEVWMFQKEEKEIFWIQGRTRVGEQVKG
jgi:hypothetical protein